MSAVIVLVFLFELIAISKSETCSAQSCLKCTSSTQINCTLTHITSSYYNYYCEAPPKCIPQTNDRAVPCTGILHRNNGQFYFLASKWNNHHSGDNCNHNFGPNCLGLSTTVTSVNDDFTVTCFCFEDNCQDILNVTVFYSIGPSSSSHIIQSSLSSSSSSVQNHDTTTINNQPSMYSSINSFSSSINDFNSNSFYSSLITSSNYSTFSETSHIVIKTTPSMIITSSFHTMSSISSSIISTSITSSSSSSITVSLSPTVLKSKLGSTTVALLGVIAVLGFILVLIILLLVFSIACYCHRYSTKGRRHSHQIHFNTGPPNLELTQLRETTPLPFTLIQNIGNGKFGSVWKALYNEQTVAVKIFSPHHKASWQNERDIHILDSTPHENILEFILGDVRGSGYNAEYYIITQYYPLGSLNYFLRHNSLSWEQTWNIMHSISSGLAHLHSSNFNSKGFISEKYSIAHRDIKSSNILVKNESGQCVLADLGLAFILDPVADVRKLAISGQVGTYRYMAPEALDARVNLRDIESFKQIDVYALGLVLWEVGMRYKYDDCPVQPYQSPYFDLVGEKPTLEQMKEVVVSSKQRPPIPGKWYSNKTMKVIAHLITESWDEDSEARLTAANVSIQLENLIGNKTESQSSQQTPSLSECQEFNNGQVPETSQSSLCKKVRVSASFSGSSSAQPFVSPPVRFSVDHVGTSSNIDITVIQSLQDRDDDTLVVQTLPRIDSSSRSIYNEEPISIDATTGQHQTPATNQCITTTTDSTIHDSTDNI